MVSKSDKKNISKNNKCCGNHYPEKEIKLLTSGSFCNSEAENRYMDCLRIIKIKKYVLTSDFNILNSHHFVQHEVSKCNVGYKLNRSQGRKN